MNYNTNCHVVLIIIIIVADARDLCGVFSYLFMYKRAHENHLHMCDSMHYCRRKSHLRTEVHLLMTLCFYACVYISIYSHAFIPSMLDTVGFVTSRYLPSCKNLVKILHQQLQKVILWEMCRGPGQTWNNRLKIGWLNMARPGTIG